MEIISIKILAKDGSQLDRYPDEYFQEDLDISAIRAFLSWAVDKANESGDVQLERCAYDKAVELLGTDDLQGPRSLVIEFQVNGASYSLSITFDKASTKAYLSAHELD